MGRLVQLLGMLGSSGMGERANAASLADRMVRRAGLTWTEVLETSSEDSAAAGLRREIERLRHEAMPMAAYGRGSGGQVSEISQKELSTSTEEQCADGSRHNTGCRRGPAAARPGLDIRSDRG